MKKGILSKKVQWWKHLRDWKRIQWHKERQAEKREIKQQEKGS
jgi:hypothetical protein